jgi:hypothetical protein
MRTGTLVRPTRGRNSALFHHGSVTFLTGQSWGHTALTYRILRDELVDDLPLATVRRALRHWNEALASAPVARLRDFHLEPADQDARADILIYLRGAGGAVDGSTEIVGDRADAMVEATVRLTWPPNTSPDDIGVLGTLAVRAIGRALGIGNAADPNDPMYPAFNGVKLYPSESDIAAFAAVEEWYVARSPIFYPPRGFTIVQQHHA